MLGLLLFVLVCNAQLVLFEMPPRDDIESILKAYGLQDFVEKTPIVEYLEGFCGFLDSHSLVIYKFYALEQYRTALDGTFAVDLVVAKTAELFDIAILKILDKNPAAAQELLKSTREYEMQIVMPFLINKVVKIA